MMTAKVKFIRYIFWLRGWRSFEFSFSSVLFLLLSVPLLFLSVSLPSHWLCCVMLQAKEKLSLSLSFDFALNFNQIWIGNLRLCGSYFIASIHFHFMCIYFSRRLSLPEGGTLTTVYLPLYIFILSKRRTKMRGIFRINVCHGTKWNSNNNNNNNDYNKDNNIHNPWHVMLHRCQCYYFFRSLPP